MHLGFCYFEVLPHTSPKLFQQFLNYVKADIDIVFAFVLQVRSSSDSRGFESADLFYLFSMYL